MWLSAKVPLCKRCLLLCCSCNCNCSRSLYRPILRILLFHRTLLKCKITDWGQPFIVCYQAFRLYSCLTAPNTNRLITDSRAGKYMTALWPCHSAFWACFWEVLAAVYCSVCSPNNPVIDCYLGEYPKQPITDCRRCGKLRLRIWSQGQIRANFWFWQVMGCTPK